MPLSAQLDRDPDNFGKFTARSFALHLSIVASIGLYAFIHAHLRHNSWGANETQGAIEATLVSNAPAIPLPQDLPPTPSVLATPTPSAAPAPTEPQQKAIQQPEPDAVPIPIKEPPKQAPPKKVAQNEPPPTPQPRQLSDSRANRYPSPIQARPNTAQYGEAAPAMSRSMNSNQGPNNPVNIKGGDFGSQFPYYVDIIKRTVARNWYQAEVQPGTPAGTRASISISALPAMARRAIPYGEPQAAARRSILPACAPSSAWKPSALSRRDTTRTASASNIIASILAPTADCF